MTGSSDFQWHPASAPESRNAAITPLDAAHPPTMFVGLTVLADRLGVVRWRRRRRLADSRGGFTARRLLLMIQVATASFLVLAATRRSPTSRGSRRCSRAPLRAAPVRHLGERLVFSNGIMCSARCRGVFW